MSDRRIAVALAGVMSLLFVSSSFAQVLYQPVQYQYRASGQLYYYGGSDPRMHEHAAGPVSAGGTWGRINGWDFASGDLDRHREVSFERPLRVYSDAVGYQNAAFYGYTPTDAMNDAYANADRYFRKADALAMAQRDETGALIVPASSMTTMATASGYGITSMPRGSIMIRPMMRRPAATTATTPTSAGRGPVFIFPKDLLDRPLKGPGENKKVASAD